ncbi:phenylalanine 4-monooxygenase [Algicola sagamiensis]|uniref:phenylalanine 4-monooxygenase n=1 Tax=Algicola sagamiensis TaxID=163869 RepID=UPI00037BF164|nr:phenylalanine 4-monooxygenase [Algicola sagamiensis]
MAKSSQYVSKPLEADGSILWTPEENDVWHALYSRQIGNIQHKACDEYLDGLKILNLRSDGIPHMEELNSVLRERTGWECAAVPALIDFDEFFRLLANRKFPVATFIRRREDFDYLQEPDIFHEIFGHCAMLTHPEFAEFTHRYGQLGYEASKEDRVFLARLYWFTVEFGLIRNTDNELKIYGGGILSSPGETEYAFNSEVPERREFNIVDVLRTPYRIDIMQPIYYCIESIHQLFELSQMDIMQYVKKAKALGLFEPKFPPKEKRLVS